MKKIMLIGKMNKIMEEINDLLSKDFRVQIAPDDTNVLPGIIRINAPDLIIFNLVGIIIPDGSIFFILRNEFSEIPVLTVGTQEEMERVKRFYEGPRFQNVTRPVTYNAIISAIADRLNLSGDYFSEPTGKKRVLVVDDNSPTLRAIKGMLEDKYEVHMAPSGMKAMTSIGRHRPDIILLDYDMPICDGRQTLEMIRADEDYSNLPVIFLTGYGDKEHIEKVLALNPQGYLLKPAEEKSLKAAIAGALRA